jgi:hypothetical protein
MAWPEGKFQAGEPWEECDRCGFYYPESIITEQNGLKVCGPSKPFGSPCFDEEDTWEPPDIEE